MAELAKSTSAIAGELTDMCAIKTQQRISLILHRENARAILRRTACIHTGVHTTASRWATVADHSIDES
eukprot:2445773-Karenia_brevis.AAC.1